MEDVVLHWRPSDDLPSLLQTTQRLLQPFPLRTPPPFAPWFPAGTPGRPLPIRPARPPPVVICSGFPRCSRGAVEETCPENSSASVRVAPPPSGETEHCVASETAKYLPAGEAAEESTPPPRRSWSVSAQRGVPLNGERPLCKRFQAVLSTHRLHPLQRARWVISRHHCGPTRSLEQVWRSLCRIIQSATLPTCNANIQRDRAEIWVFCDMERAEQVGRHLKGALQLSGTIKLSVRAMPNILSL